TNFWSGDDGLTFSEFLDVINPLQHLPVVSSIYRAVTGDEISLGARLLGGALFGGPLGVLAAGVNAAFEEMSGGNIAEHAVALFEEITGSDDDKPQLALGPQAAKAGAIAATVGPVSQQAPPAINPGIAPGGIPAPTAILPPIKPPSITPAVPATNSSPAETRPSNGIPRQGAMRLPAALNAPSQNGIALFSGQPGDAITRRISQSILEGQRAQAQLLLSSVSGGKGNTGKPGHATDKKETQGTQGMAAIQTFDRRQARSLAQQASQSAVQAMAQAGGRAQPPTGRPAHPNLPPSGAPGIWFQQAMDNALDRYQSTSSLKRAVGIPASSRR
ncbi:MAG: hypothetical protein HQ514_06325, partial [Rhodospirillales bacterium]|nr:hypothetical protein [Rhodospirillales bacterium]